MEEIKKNKAKRILSIFLIVQVVFWLLCAAFNLFTSDTAPVKKVFISALMMINAGVFFTLMLLLGKNKPQVFFITLGVLLVSAAFLISGGITGWEYVILAFIAVSIGVLVWSGVKNAYRFVKEKIEELLDSDDHFISVWSQSAHII